MNKFLNSLQPAQQGDLPGIPGKLIGRFQNHGFVLQRGMVHNSRKSGDSQTAFTEAFMPVLVTGKGILGVVQMEGLQFAQTDHPVKLFQNTVQIPDNIVAAVIDMAGLLYLSNMNNSPLYHYSDVL